MGSDWSTAAGGGCTPRCARFRSFAINKANGGGQPTCPTRLARNDVIRRTARPAALLT